MAIPSRRWAIPTGARFSGSWASANSAVSELADAMPISRPAVSRHLRLLKQAGLVTEQAEGTRRIYQLQEEGLRAVHAYLNRVWGEAAVRFALLADNAGPRPKP